MKHILTIDEFAYNDLFNLFNLTDEIRKNPQTYSQSLNGKVIATLFYEPSTRTRLSFEAAIQRLGGSVISTENARELSSASKGESLRDTIRVVQGYADAIVLRHYENDAAEVAASVANVPIINAGSGSHEHPTQALLDMYTIYAAKGRLEGLKYVLAGDLLYGRTVHSLVKKLAQLSNIQVFGLSTPDFALPSEYIHLLQQNDIPYQFFQKSTDLPSDIDVIYQTRTQFERLANEKANVPEIIIDTSVLNHFSKETILLHPLPRNREIALHVDDDPRALYFQQAANGMYVRMALMHLLLQNSSHKENSPKATV